MATQKQTNKIEIPEIREERIIVEMIGTAPLLVHAYPEKARRQLAGAKTGEAKQPRTKTTPEDEAMSCRYLDAKGRDCVTAISIKSALAEAMITVSKSLGQVFVYRNVYIQDQLVPLQFKKRVVFEAFPRNANGNPEARWRPEYHDWSCSVAVDYDPDAISKADIINLFARAGKKIGIGDWRVSKRGVHGTWRVGKVKVVSAQATKKPRAVA
jgi:hypothetical protein